MSVKSGHSLRAPCVPPPLRRVAIVDQGHGQKTQLDMWLRSKQRWIGYVATSGSCPAARATVLWDPGAGAIWAPGAQMAPAKQLLTRNTCEITEAKNIAVDHLGFASDALGFASDSLGFASESPGFATEKLGGAPEKLGFAPEKLGLAS